MKRSPLATTPAPPKPMGWSETSSRVSVSVQLTCFTYLRLAYYCHIKIRALHFVSNFQFSLYRMLAGARRLAVRHRSPRTCFDCLALALRIQRHIFVFRCVWCSIGLIRLKFKWNSWSSSTV